MVTPLKVHGVDISHYQGGALDMAGAKRRGLEFIYHKATEGDSWRDDRYAERREQARKAGIPFGAYHFARPERGDAAAEARHFLAVAKPKPGDLSPCLDLETTEGLTLDQLRTWAATWCATVEKAVPGSRVVLYTPFDLGPVEKGRARWRPRYNNDNRPPVLPYDIWQFSNGVYGVPNQIAGFGHVDLNTLRKGFTTASLLIKPKETKPPKGEPKTRKLRMAVAPMQFSDTDAATAKDFDVILTRGYDVVYGTEVGPGSNSDPLLKEACKEHGYKLAFFSRYDTWVAVKASLVKRGTWKTGAEHAIDRSSRHTPKPPGRWGDKAVVWAQCEIEGLGVCSFGAVHPLTHGGAGAELKAKTDDQHAAVVAKFVKEHGKGKQLVWVGGDWNLHDGRQDLTQGMWPGVSCWDELKKWPNTGHGNIDAILRYKPDGRVVRFTGARSLNDKKVPLATDHFLTEAEVLVEELAA